MKNKLKFLVEKNNVNISKMARELGVSRNSLYRVMNGCSPSAELMLMISAYFKKGVNDIFFIQTVKHIGLKREGKIAPK